MSRRTTRDDFQSYDMQRLTHVDRLYRLSRESAPETERPRHLQRQRSSSTPEGVLYEDNTRRTSREASRSPNTRRLTNIDRSIHSRHQYTQETERPRQQRRQSFTSDRSLHEVNTRRTSGEAPQSSDIRRLTHVAESVRSRREYTPETERPRQQRGQSSTPNRSLNEANTRRTSREAARGPDTMILTQVDESVRSRREYTPETDRSSEQRRQSSAPDRSLHEGNTRRTSQEASQSPDTRRLTHVDISVHFCHDSTPETERQRHQRQSSTQGRVLRGVNIYINPEVNELASNDHDMTAIRLDSMVVPSFHSDDSRHLSDARKSPRVHRQRVRFPERQRKKSHLGPKSDLEVPDERERVDQVKQMRHAVDCQDMAFSSIGIDEAGPSWMTSSQITRASGRSVNIDEAGPSWMTSRQTTRTSKPTTSDSRSNPYAQRRNLRRGRRYRRTPRRQSFYPRNKNKTKRKNQTERKRRAFHSAILKMCENMELSKCI